MGYLMNFIVYMFAMTGVIAAALLVFKNTMQGKSKSAYLKITDKMQLAPRKTLYIVSAGRERFLIAGDADKTTLISKLEEYGEFETPKRDFPPPVINSCLLHKNKPESAGSRLQDLINNRMRV